ncbi:MAG: hypothetical protein M1824_002315 [Vezdaea acicularis]|nr:MAG: hypothetical protein M1824_002315 [Vezdaea acicularis]
MPADIRSFFGGGSQVGTSSQERKGSKREGPETTSKRRSKVRKIVEDSEDDDVAVTPKNSTPKKPIRKKAAKAESPKGETTTASSYFATNGKSKPSRSTPSKQKSAPSYEVTISPSRPTAKIESSTISTPKGPKHKSSPPTKSNVNSRTSSRNKKTSNYKEESDDGMVLPAEVPSADELVAVDAKVKRRIDDGYEEDEEVTQPRQKRSGREGKPVAGKRKGVKEQDADFEEDHVMADKKSQTVSRGARKSKGSPSKTNGKKRKSDEFEEDESYSALSVSPAKTTSKATPVKQAPAKKPRTPVRKAENEENAEVKMIYDSIPLVRPPSPPPQSGEPQKFNFKGAHANAGAPAAAGSKALPVGADNCLAGLTFVFTGLLDTLARDDGQNLVKKYGGKVTQGAPSRNTSFVVMGSDAGPKKIEKIKQLNIKTIDEDGLFELIRKLPANGGNSKAAAANEEKKKKEAEKVMELATEMEMQEKARIKVMQSIAANRTTAQGAIAKDVVDTRLWTTKYAPTTTSQICGNKGQVEKLQRWLQKWPENLKRNFSHAGPDGSYKFRAVIIHGPPGIGKTTAAHLVANLEGYDVLESNASDTRSKKLVDTGLKGILDNTSLLGFFAGDEKKVESKKKKIVLIMDEVDGMSAGDRGGVGALAQVCKKTSIPVILICNDRRLPKMKPFDFVAYDLGFRRPTTNDIRSRIASICYREGIQLPGQVIDALVEGSGADIRQIINMISTAKMDKKSMSFDQGKQMSKAWEKHIVLKPWDIVGKLLGGGMFHANSNKTLNDKIELYFNDHDFTPLMIQENYLKTTPAAASQYRGKEQNLKSLEMAEKAAASISDGDLVDRMIHGAQQQWSLMPTHAVFSTVRPASFVAGSMAGHGRTEFTRYLGNLSKQTKLARFVKEIQGHMRLRASGDRHEIRQQYLPMLWYQLIKRLEVEGKESVDEIIDLMDSYFLTKDDWDSILELGVGPMDMEGVKLETQAKASFTRLYNQRTHPMPYIKASNVVAPAKASKAKPDLEEAFDDSDVGEDAPAEKPEGDEEDELDVAKDRYIKQPKKKAPTKKAQVKKAPTRKKGVQKEELSQEEMSDSEDVKPKQSRTKAKAKGSAGKGRR